MIILYLYTFYIFEYFTQLSAKNERLENQRYSLTLRMIVSLM